MRRTFPILKELGPENWTDYFYPEAQDYHERCCGCGLIHEKQHRIIDGRIAVRVRQKPGLTAAYRRREKAR